MIEILGGLDSPTNPKVQGVGIITQNGRAAISVYLRDDVPGPDPVLPKKVMGVSVVINKCAPFETHKKEARYRSNREKAHSVTKRVASQLASKFQKRLNLGWPPSFKLTDLYTVIVESTVPDDQPDSHKVTVKVLAGIDTYPPFVADITVNQMSKAEAVGDFIKQTENGLEAFQSTIAV